MRSAGTRFGRTSRVSRCLTRQQSTTAVYVGSYDGKFYALNAQSGAVKWKFATEGERRFEAKGIHGLQPRNQTIADRWDVFLSSPVVGNGLVYFGSGDGNLYAVAIATGELWC